MQQAMWNDAFNLVECAEEPGQANRAMRHTAYRTVIFGWTVNSNMEIAVMSRHVVLTLYILGTLPTQDITQDLLLVDLCDTLSPVGLMKLSAC